MGKLSPPPPNSLAKEALLILITYLTVFLTIIFFAGPVILLRQLAKLTAFLFKPELGAAMSKASGLTCVDTFYTYPSLHSVVGTHYTDKPVQLNAVRRRMKEVIRSRKFPELTQTLRRWMGFYFWGSCYGAPFDLSKHISICPFEGSNMALKDVEIYQEYLCKKPWTKGQPFWEIVLYPEYKGGTAFSLRVHHCFADGTAHVALLNAISSAPPSSPPKTMSIVSKIWRAFVELIEFCVYLYPAIKSSIKDLETHAWIKPEAERSDKCYVYGNHGMELDLVKKAAHIKGLSVSQLLMAELTTSLREEWEFSGEPIPDKMSGIFPLPREGHSGGLTNYLTFSTIKLPVGISDPKQREAFIVTEFANKKRWASLFYHVTCFTGILQQLTMWTPKFFPYCSMAITTFALPPEPWTLFGAQVKRSSFAFDVSQHVPFGFMFIGYQDRLFMWAKGRSDVVRTKDRIKALIDRMQSRMRAVAIS